MKYCPKCKTSKREDEFHKNRRNSDGFQSWCRTCSKAPNAEGLTSNQRYRRKVGVDGLTNAQRDRRKVGADGLTSSARCRRRVGEDGLTPSQRTNKKNPDTAVNYHYKTTYGITLDEYKRMLQEQRGVCAICNNPPVRGRLHIDHDHESGKIRALLCEPCNQGIGFLKDSSEVAQLAVNYLKQHGK